MLSAKSALVRILAAWFGAILVLFCTTFDTCVETLFLHVMVHPANTEQPTLVPNEQVRETMLHDRVVSTFENNQTNLTENTTARNTDVTRLPDTIYPQPQTLRITIAWLGTEFCRNGYKLNP